MEKIQHQKGPVFIFAANCWRGFASQNLRIWCGLIFYKDGRFLRRYTETSDIAIFLKDAMEYAPDDSRRTLSYVPNIRKPRNNIQYLIDFESHAFCGALEDDQNGLSYKYRAIGMLLYYTGIRCSDICGLALDSIDLQCSVIRFTQQKTRNSVEIHLSAVVRNALVDYCVHERPATDSPYLFVTDRAPHRHLIKGGIQWAVVKIMEATAVLSAIVGHASSKSLDSYLYADMKHIRECTLGLEKYPMAEEVFSCV